MCDTWRPFHKKEFGYVTTDVIHRYIKSIFLRLGEYLSFLVMYANYSVNFRFFNQYFQSKMKRLFLDNIKGIRMIQLFLTTQTPQLLPPWFYASIMKDGKVSCFANLFLLPSKCAGVDQKMALNFIFEKFLLNQLDLGVIIVFLMLRDDT